MIDVAAAANEMEIPEEGAIFPMATPVLATPAAFMGGIAISSAVVGAFEAGRNG
ncbi:MULTISPECIES: hypothetical protein [Streptomyces]|uniref:hypothetical protein n=1 Tax=Streptomyces TaxID=1883 RepID=UPI0015E08255|nr:MULTISPECIES: hypothetical protein [Streptomyces]QRX96412.1 hypothetical protein JNO44_41490 [Streptomyces noursei]UJB44848.1 hypothetical protein HRD51_32280 [Streptomyces sp. A1-5]